MKNLLNWKKETPVSLYSPFSSLQHEIDQAINHLYHLFKIPSFSSTDIDKWVLNPSVDIVEDDDTFKVEMELPGMSEDDIKVFVDNGILSVQGQKTTSQKDEGKNYITREIGYGSYERNIPLPEYVETDKAKASFKKGMLWVSFPKKSDRQKNRLEVKVEQAAE